MLERAPPSQPGTDLFSRTVHESHPTCQHKSTTPELEKPAGTRPDKLSRKSKPGPTIVGSPALHPTYAIPPTLARSCLSCRGPLVARGLDDLSSCCTHTVQQRPCSTTAGCPLGECALHRRQVTPCRGPDVKLGAQEEPWPMSQGKRSATKWRWSPKWGRPGHCRWLSDVPDSATAEHIQIKRKIRPALDPALAPT